MFLFGIYNSDIFLRATRRPFLHPSQKNENSPRLKAIKGVNARFSSVFFLPAFLSNFATVAYL